MDNSKEYILCAALRRKVPRSTDSYHQNDLDQIEIGYRHHDIRNRFGDEVSCSPKDQGFYTSKGRFVDRKEAMEIAYWSGQVRLPIYEVSTISMKDGEPTATIRFNDLFSEDLY